MRRSLEMKNPLALASNVVVRVRVGEEYSAGGVILSTNKSREAMAREEATIMQLGETAFDDLDKLVPKEGDTVLIARYDGKTVGEKDGFEYRVIPDTHILALLEE